MRHRTDIISTLPARRLFVSRWVVNGETFYVGRINGRVILHARTREAAIRSLLRRAAEATVH